jgi:capsular polysaccharide biosynthesis protein
MLVGQKPPPSDCAHGVCLLPNAPPEGIGSFTQPVAKAVTTMPVAQAAADRLNPPNASATKILENTSARTDPGTIFVEVTYTSTNPKTAQLTANAIGKALSEKISEVSPGANGITATVWSSATLPQNPVSPDPLLNTVIALVLGSLLGVALAFLLEYIDDRWDSPEQLEEISGVPTFGVIPRFVDLGSRKGGILAIKKGS